MYKFVDTLAENIIYHAVFHKIAGHGIVETLEAADYRRSILHIQLQRNQQVSVSGICLRQKAQDMGMVRLNQAGYIHQRIIHRKQIQHDKATRRVCLAKLCQCRKQRFARQHPQSTPKYSCCTEITGKILNSRQTITGKASNKCVSSRTE